MLAETIIMVVSMLLNGDMNIDLEVTDYREV